MKDGLHDAVKLLYKWTPGFTGPMVVVHRDDVVAIEALWDDVTMARRTKLHLRGGSTLAVSELFDTLAVSPWWEKRPWNT